MSISKVVTTNR